MRDGGIVFEVTDNGPGLPPGGETRVFERFFRGGKTKAGGNGLGLAIVKGFAALMGAKIEAQNRRAHAGAIFTLAFPETATA
jgi:two-component system sensor histidine kinase KdpD